MGSSIFPSTPREWAERIMGVIVLWLSLTIHEWAHAITAATLGDDTPGREGRLTLNPMAHADPWGTWLLPMLNVPFGWARPVNVNPARFRRGVNMNAGMALTASAGPVSNLLLAVSCAVAIGLNLKLNPGARAGHDPLSALLLWGLSVNVSLAVFNLLPVPPLDGSRIVAYFLPARYQEAWAGFVRFGPLLLIMLVASGGFILSGPINLVRGALYEVVRRIAVS
jgi:Zn-dependent protease